MEARPLDESQVEQHLLDTTEGPGRGRGRSRSEFRISIAGAQEKTALLLEDGEILGAGGEPDGIAAAHHPFGVLAAIDRVDDLLLSEELDQRRGHQHHVQARRPL